MGKCSLSVGMLIVWRSFRPLYFPPCVQRVNPDAPRCPPYAAHTHLRHTFGKKNAARRSLFLLSKSMKNSEATCNPMKWLKCTMQKRKGGSLFELKTTNDCWKLFSRPGIREGEGFTRSEPRFGTRHSCVQKVIAINRINRALRSTVHP